VTSVRHATGHFKNHRGLLLYYQAWRVPQTKAVLVFVHGLGEHSGRYRNPVEYFTERGYTCYAYDHQGHGRSEGQRCYAPTLRSYLKDLKLFLDYVKDHEKGEVLILVGHSLGGQIVLNYGADSGVAVLGVIASSPNVRVFNVPKIKILSAKLGTWIVPRLPLPNDLDPNDLSHDPAVVKAYVTDPLVCRKITIRLAAEILTNQEKMDTLASQFRVPCLLLHGGGDRICDPRGTKEFYERIPLKDKQLKIYEGLYHEIFNEYENQQVFSDMERWIERH